MPNEFYTKTGAPSTSSAGASATIRGEFAAIEAAFNKLPELSTNQGDLLVVNASGTGVDAVAPDTPGKFPGLTLFALNLKNAAGTVTNLISNTTTAIRNWSFPDKDGVIAMISDITGGIVSAAFTGVSSSGPITTTSPYEGIGYGTGAGGSVTQITSRSTSVTINKICGRIVSDQGTIPAGTTASFFVFNSALFPNSGVVLINSSVSLASLNVIAYGASSSGSFKISLAAPASSDFSGTVVIDFLILRSVQA